MPKGPDPRLTAAPLEDVPRLLREGAEEFNARRFWDAHERWEAAWHGLRAAGDEGGAGYVRGMILVAAALENAVRKKEAGFKRQCAEGLYHLLKYASASEAVGHRDAAAWRAGVALLYADACRRRKWSWWNDAPWDAPRLELA